MPLFKKRETGSLSPFTPPFGLRNPHLQTILSSLKIRALREKQLDSGAREILVDAGDGVRLLGFYTGQESGSSRGLILLLHGWEGGADSTYMLTTGGFFYRKGYDIFRLNLRDHGNSHHLNEGLFNSSLIEETHRAVQKVADAQGNLPFFIVGFSLGVISPCVWPYATPGTRSRTSGTWWPLARSWTPKRQRMPWTGAFSCIVLIF